MPRRGTIQISPLKVKVAKAILDFEKEPLQQNFSQATIFRLTGIHRGKVSQAFDFWTDTGAIVQVDNRLFALDPRKKAALEKIVEGFDELVGASGSTRTHEITWFWSERDRGEGTDCSQLVHLDLSSVPCPIQKNLS